MYLDVYIGRLDDPQFVENKDKPGGAVPHSHSPMFPNGSRAFWELTGRINRGAWPGGEATQHIAYVAPASKAQISGFLDDLYGARTAGQVHPQAAPLTPVEELRAWVDALEDDGLWCLVADEL